MIDINLSNSVSKQIAALEIDTNKLNEENILKLQFQLKYQK